MKPLASLANVKVSPTQVFPNGDHATSYDEGETPEHATDLLEPVPEQESSSNSVELSQAKPAELNDSAESAKLGTGLLTRNRRSVVKPRVMIVKDRTAEEGASKDPVLNQFASVSKESKLFAEEKVNLKAQENPVSTEEVGDVPQAVVASELSETGEKPPVLLRRGRRPLIKPLLPKTEAGTKQTGKSKEISVEGVGSAEEKPLINIDSSEMKSPTSLAEEVGVSPPRKRPCLRSPERDETPELTRPRPRISARLSRGSAKR
ncbi:hypothetical protein COOONC_28413 [Cooperia oncophora]